MSQRLYRVTGVSVESNQRGQEMRRVHFTALGGDVFGAEIASANGTISELVTLDEAERLTPGAVFSLTLHPHEA